MNALERAVIVAAGKGKRLMPLTSDKPKALIEVEGQSLIRRSVEQLLDKGVKEIALVVGYRKEMLMDHLKKYPITYYYNPFFAGTNNMASLWFAKQFVAEGFLYLHSDLIYDPHILDMLLAAEHPDTLIVEKKSCEEEAMKVKVEGEWLVESSKEIGPEETAGEWIGLAKFGASYSHLLFAKIEQLIEADQSEVYDTMAFSALAAEGHPLAINYFKDLPWAEIDTPEDLESARETFAAH